MDLTGQDVALIFAGLIGAGVALVHGVILQRLMVRPIDRFLRDDGSTPASVRRLVPLLLHFSTFAWLLGGLSLIAAAAYMEGESLIAIAASVGSLYLFGAVANCWGTRGRHPGWMLMTLALVLIGIGIR